MSNFEKRKQPQFLGAVFDAGGSAYITGKVSYTEIWPPPCNTGQP